MNPVNPVCPDDCDFDLGSVAYNNCAPKIYASQLKRIFVAKVGSTPFTDITDEAEWHTRLSQTGTVAGYIRALTVTGGKPAPANVTKVIDNGITVGIGKDHTLNFITYQVTDENYEFMRKTECSIQVLLFAYETMGGKMYAFPQGQVVTIVMDDVLGDGDDDVENLTGVITWRSKFSPARFDSPIFDYDVNAGGTTPTTFDTVQTFATETEVTNNGVTTTFTATDADLKFEFNKITTPIGSPANMVLTLAGTDVASIDYPVDYNGAAYRFTDAAGTVHNGVFASGSHAL